MKKNIRSGIIGNIICLFLLGLTFVISQSVLIIYMGVRIGTLVFYGSKVLAAAILVVFNILWIRSLLRQRKRNNATTIPITYNENEAIDPDMLRLELTNYRKERPALQAELETAYHQLDSMDRKQEKIKNIFERNKVSSLHEVESTIELAERVMFRNTVKIINRAILWDPDEWNKPGKEAVYEGHRTYINKVLGKNDEILSKCDVLLAETINYMDEEDGDTDSGKMHLDAMTETVQLLRKLEE